MPMLYPSFFNSVGMRLFSAFTTPPIAREP